MVCELLAVQNKMLGGFAAEDRILGLIHKVHSLTTSKFFLNIDLGSDSSFYLLDKLFLSSWVIERGPESLVHQ